ncbi:cytochrome d ubiquinol oxidase subunit II [Limobrevibacterium gyesilva]|uniref:Cytochrome d ubiquinol oxidase subunit II n=1 Tax=Limobrevibacterium gyesilva TaxID=2991712 RepID=A0AA41YR04_9PROT|nr:cytochrome d ubiquinol oxidase subunit II [Limobrevibacterium gyesilva]MCW3476977.1 cytochrome d ubiquinol oxidase subunit II [Limobrevibacterium gyesilva]
MLASLDLPLIWAALIAFAVLAYVVLDGFDLGVGILFAVEHDATDRDVMVNSVAPVWDGNETWLILGGGGLMAVFPLAYAVILPALYPAIIAMLLALIFRGVAFEFRFRAASRAGRLGWDIAFFGGSTLAGFCQGLALGGLLQGIKVENRAYAGGWWDWLTGFTILCGLAVVIGYALLGACWLIWRTEGELQSRCRRHARSLGVGTLALIVVVSLWTPMLNPAFSQRWFGWPGIVLTSPVPILVALLAWQFWRGLSLKHDVTPFLCALGWFVLCYAGLGISLYPAIVPPSITIRDAAAPPESQGFLLVGAIVLVPMILAYTGYAYWVFRGKVRPGMHYH